jgi:hypothetical protein
MIYKFQIRGGEISIKSNDDEKLKEWKEEGRE